MPLKTIEHTVAAELVIDLPKPIRALDGGTMQQLVLREPSAGAVQLAEQELGNSPTPAAQRRYQAKLVAHVAGVAPEALAELPIGLFTRAAAYVVGPTRIDVSAADDFTAYDELNIQLSEPIVSTKHTVELIEVREPTLAMMEKAERLLKDGTNAAARSYQIALVEATTGLPAIVVMKMPISVLNLAAVFAQGFTDPDRETGKR